MPEKSEESDQRTIGLHLKQHDLHNNWLGAAKDSQISRALRLMTSIQERCWTLDMLSTEVDLSRSAFAARFKTLVGEAPLEHLTRCLMQKAAQLLREIQPKDCRRRREVRL